MRPTDGFHASKVAVRLAYPSEAEHVRRLDDDVFPEMSPDLQRAPEGELEEATKVDDVYFLEVDDKVAAYIHMDRQVPGVLYLSGIGVVAEMQNNGLGTFLVKEVFKELDLLPGSAAHPPVYTVTSPHNLRMLHVLRNLGFAGRWALPDHFGPGRHRLGYQMLLPTSGLHKSDLTKSVKLGDMQALGDLLDEGWAIRNHFSEQGELILELSPVGGQDFAECPRPKSAVNIPLSVGDYEPRRSIL